MITSPSEFGLRYRGGPGGSNHPHDSNGGNSGTVTTTSSTVEESINTIEEQTRPLLSSPRLNPVSNSLPDITALESGVLDPVSNNTIDSASTSNICYKGSPSLSPTSVAATPTGDSSSLSSPSKVANSILSTKEYVTKLHPTLIQHYYDIMSSLRGGEEGGSAPPALAFSEIVLGDIIGKGGFSFVHEINDVKLQEVYDTSAEESKARAAFAAEFEKPKKSESNSSTNTTSTTSTTSTKAPPQKSTSQQFVLKTLRPDLPEDEHNKGIIDLAVEAQFLAALSHPHILSLRGTANSDPLESRYFVILDRLVSTMDYKLKIWRKDVGINMGTWCGPYIGYCCGRRHVLHRIWMERFEVARDVASALEYLHKQDIVYRDLKPDNIGFNADGQLKMFDFGLAKRITNADKAEDDLYHLTGNTGSLRYMAPEVALNKPYSLSVDAYSFGILFWQLCALTTPYSGYSCKMHADLVVGKGYRPKPDSSWPESWSLLMRQCWAADHRSRPTFEYVMKVLSEELEELNAEGDSFMTDDQHKGTEKIRARKKKSIKIRARKDGQRLDVDTRLVSLPTGPTERRHDTNIV
mmetsp:Transcript_19672/g.38928  ORF Transcript_19672/g.38928 Transcript_19672/m.38928 type:complete len:579 (-) Transcript_19672:279-2015(-)